MPGALGFSPAPMRRVTAGSTATSPSTASSCSRVTPPGRSSRGGVQVRSMMVDSTPTVQGPPSTMASIFPSMSSHMWAAVVGLGRPEVFPEGAATGMSAASRMARHTGWEGQRIPTVSSPAVTTSGTTSRRGRIMVSGPGQ